MRKIITFIISLFPLFLTICAFIIILVQLPLFIIQALIVMIYTFALVLFFLKIFHQKEKIYIYSKAVVFFCVFTCCVAIASLRTFLVIENFDEQLFLIRNIGLFICKENYICGFFSTVLIVCVILYFSKLHILKNIEKSARISLDNMSSKIWEINHKEINGELKKDEADSLRKLANENLDYYSGFVGASKYLIGTLWAFLGLFIIVTAGGFTVGLLEFNLSWHEALNQYIVLSTGYLIIFVIPLFVVSVSFGIK